MKKKYEDKLAAAERKRIADVATIAKLKAAAAAAKAAPCDKGLATKKAAAEK